MTTAMAAGARPPELPGLLLAYGQDGARGTFVTALLTAAILHVALLLAVSFVPPAPKPPPESALEVLILEEAGQPTPLPAQDALLSQRDRAGESMRGNAEITQSAEPETAPPEETEPTPSESETGAEPESAPPPPQHSVVPTSQEAKPEVTTSLIPVQKTAPVLSARTQSDMPPVSATEAVRETETRIDAAQILASRSLEVSRLTASLEAKSTAYSKRVRRKSISAATREFKYASYLGAWARKVERIGNINYPEAAKQERLYGNLILHVAVRSDGSVENIRVVKSSGYDLLDDAAIQIVELSAPFSPFPPEIAAETDVLDIVRTWQFMRGGVLGWER
jgi:periplasmic protein TonB